VGKEIRSFQFSSCEFNKLTYHRKVEEVLLVSKDKGSTPS
jgi:hypothetical protein